MQRLMLLLLLLLREQPPFLEIWATGAGELGQLLFLNCPSEQRGQPRTAAAHGPYRSLGKDLRGPLLLSSAQRCPWASPSWGRHQSPQVPVLPRVLCPDQHSSHASY